MCLPEEKPCRGTSLGRGLAQAFTGKQVEGIDCFYFANYSHVPLELPNAAVFGCSVGI